MADRESMLRLASARWVLAASAAVCAAVGAPAQAESALAARCRTAVAPFGEPWWGALLVADAGEVVWQQASGLADRKKVPLSVDHVFDLGTVAQQWTRLLVLDLCDAGKLRLDDPIRKFTKDWPAEKAAMTVRHVLQHRSGLPRDAQWGGGRAGASRTAWQAIAEAPLDGPPGGETRYSQLNNNLLVLVCEVAGKDKFDKLLETRALRGFGMTHAGVLSSRLDAKRLTTRRSDADAAGEALSAFDWNYVHRGVRGVLASPSDLHAFLARVTDDKKGLSSDARTVWLTKTDGGGLYVQQEPVSGTAAWRMYGDVKGFKTRLTVWPSRRAWVVVCTDDQSPAQELEAALVAAVGNGGGAAAAGPTTVPVAGASAGAPPPKASAAAVQRFAGRYELPNGGGVFVVRAQGDGAVLLGEGLVASARLDVGAWPTPDEARLRKAEDRGMFVLDRVRAGDASIDRDGFVDAAQGEALADELQRRGAQSFRWVGSRRER
ncbi:MAG: hypothetical protein RL398_1075, partial [Planctomycetota bacterium]